MPAIDDILVDNLKDALSQAQRLILWGVGSAALLLFLSVDAPDLIRQEESVSVPVVGAAAPMRAALIFWLAYFAFGISAYLAIGRIRKTISEIDDKRAVEAVLQRLTLVTVDSRLLRVGAALLAPLLILAGYLLEHGRSTVPVDLLTTLSGFVVVFLPYLAVAVLLWKPFIETGRHRA
jgi:hypothetical protein